MRPIAPNEIEAASDVLGRAFADNPGYRAFLPWMTDAERLRAVRAVKRGFVRAAVKHQVTDAVERDGRVVAASLVCDPGQYPPSLRAKVWQASGCVSLGPRAIRNFLVVDAFLSRHHLREPHFYLFVLGVHPDWQGRGLGKELLARLAARADAAGLPCYLETDKESSVRLYESAGYAVLADDMLLGTRFWRMRRPPRGF